MTSSAGQDLGAGECRCAVDVCDYVVGSGSRVEEIEFGATEDQADA
jgi:hypothetical protein